MKGVAGKRLQIKLCAIVISVTVVALALAGTALVRHVEEAEHAAASEHLLHKSRIIRDLLQANHDTLVVAAEKSYALFESYFHGQFRLDPDKSIDLDGIRLATLTLDGRQISSDNWDVKNFTHGSGGHAATIFVRHGDDFLRLATSLPGSDGQYAVGTALDHDHPAYKRLLRGEPYAGYARLFDRSYMTKYKPVADPSGEVIGALFVGLDLTSTIAEISEHIRRIQVGQTGYVFVLDAAPGKSFGNLVIHPRYQGRNIFEVADARQLPFFRQVLAKADGLVGMYQFKDPASGDRLREKIAAFAEFPEWHWIIGVGTFLDEFAEGSEHLQAGVVGAMLISALAIALTLSLLIRSHVLAPLLAMHQTLQASEERFRTLVTSSDDIIFTIDADGRYSGIFGKGIEAHAMTPEMFMGKLPQEAFGHEIPALLEGHARALAGEHVEYDLALDRPNGRFDFQVSLSPMRDATGKTCGLVGIARDNTERKRAADNVRHMAEHDGLTGLPNRMLMQDRLEQAIRQAERAGKGVGLLFIDLDHFKEVNDRHGHEAGDQLLKAVAARLQECVRQSDTVARLGGDEFVIVVSEVADPSASVLVAAKLLEAFAMPFDIAGASLAVSPSIGLAIYPFDATEASGLLKLADAAMYRAKSAGRNTYCGCTDLTAVHREAGMNAPASRDQGELA